MGVPRGAPVDATPGVRLSPDAFASCKCVSPVLVGGGRLTGWGAPGDPSCVISPAAKKRHREAMAWAALTAPPALHTLLMQKPRHDLSGPPLTQPPACMSPPVPRTHQQHPAELGGAPFASVPREPPATRPGRGACGGAGAPSPRRGGHGAAPGAVPGPRAPPLRAGTGRKVGHVCLGRSRNSSGGFKTQRLGLG